MTDYFFPLGESLEMVQERIHAVCKGWMEHPWKVIKVFELFDRLNDSKGGENAA